MLTEKEVEEIRKDITNQWVDEDEVTTTFRTLRIAMAEAYEAGDEAGYERAKKQFSCDCECGCFE